MAQSAARISRLANHAPLCSTKKIADVGFPTPTSGFSWVALLPKKIAGVGFSTPTTNSPGAVILMGDKDY